MGQRGALFRREHLCRGQRIAVAGIAASAEKRLRGLAALHGLLSFGSRPLKGCESWLTNLAIPLHLRQERQSRPRVIRSLRYANDARATMSV